VQDKIKNRGKDSAHTTCLRIKIGKPSAKRQKILKKFENSSMKTATEQFMSLQTPLGSVMEFEILTENLNMHCIAPS
jgi:hypothetical protein